MVKLAARYVQPANVCDACQKHFVAGDRCVVVVRVPDGGYDTLCVEDWACIVASSGAWLRQHIDDGQTSVDRLIASALDDYSGEKD